MTDEPTVFSCVRVFLRVTGGTLVTWNLDPRFVRLAKPPYVFSLYVSETGMGDDYVKVCDAAPNANWAVDPTQRLFAKGARLSYQVRLVAATKTFISNPQQATGNLTALQDPKVQAILRKENLQIRRAGINGWLYKRMTHGTICPECGNPDTGTMIGGNECTTCYGSGYVGGYFAPIWFPLLSSAKAPLEPRRLQMDEMISMKHDQQCYRRAPACPWLDTTDVWVQADSDQRWHLQRIGPIEFRGIPIIYDPIELRLIPATDIVYRLPRPAGL